MGVLAGAAVLGRQKRLLAQCGRGRPKSGQVGSLNVAGPVLYSVFAGDKAAGPLATMKVFMSEHNAVIMMIVLLVLGAKLLGSGIAGLSD